MEIPINTRATGRSEIGKFKSRYLEPRGKMVALRLPQSLDSQLRKSANHFDVTPSELAAALIELAIVYGGLEKETVAEYISKNVDLSIRSAELPNIKVIKTRQAIESLEIPDDKIAQAIESIIVDGVLDFKTINQKNKRSNSKLERQRRLKEARENLKAARRAELGLEQG